MAAASPPARTLVRIDVHMSDLAGGPATGLAGSSRAEQPAAAFSLWRRPLGAGEGWAEIHILFNERVRDEFANLLFHRPQTPGAAGAWWQRLSDDVQPARLIPGSDQPAALSVHQLFRTAFRSAAPSPVEVTQSSVPCCRRAMAGLMMPAAVSHGEGQVEARDSSASGPAGEQVGPSGAARFVDNFPVR